ncbi:MAG: DUF2950 family protein [Planctomycetota bacterium]
MRKPACLFLCVLVCGIALNARALDISADDIFPEDTVAALIIPDLAAARTQSGQTKLGEMFAQPEIQQFLKPVLAELRTQYEGLRKANPAVPSLVDLDAALLSGELALGVRVLQNNLPKVASAWFMLRPKDMAALQHILPPELLQGLQAGEPMKMGPAGQCLIMTKERLLWCSSDADLQVLLSRAQNPAAAAAGSLSKAPAYAAAKASSPNAAGWLYVAPDKVMELIYRGLKDVEHNPDADKVKALMQALGMENTTAYFMALNFRNGLPVLEGGYWSKKEPADGLPGLVAPPEGFAPSPEAFAIAAPDAPYLAAGYLNLGQIFPLIRRCVQAVSPETAVWLDLKYEELTRNMQVDLEKEVLASIGPEFVAAQTPTNTGTPLSFFPGMIYSFPVKNGAQLEEALKRVGDFINRLPQPEPKQYSFKKVTIAGNTAYYVSGILMPASPVFCLAKNRLLMGTSVNALRRGLEQLNAPANILSNSGFQQTLARVTGKPFDPAHLPASFSYGIDDGSGSGSLLLAGAYLATAGGITAALSEIPVPGQPAPPPVAPGVNPVLEFLTRPAGRTLLPLATTVDLALWPDELFFSKYRVATGACLSIVPGAKLWRTELPPPGPTGSGMSLTTTTAVVAIIAAVAIPSLLRSRMAANETAAAASCKAYAEAQEIYHRTDYNNDGVLEYAQALKGDWSLLENKAGQGDLALIDKSFADAEGPPSKHGRPKAGYCFKILKAQGANAAGGKRSYLAKGPDGVERMTLGYALVAYPAAYDATGRDTFMINNSGTIYQADLGLQTPAIVEQMTEFDPDPNKMWTPAD